MQMALPAGLRQRQTASTRRALLTPTSNRNERKRPEALVNARKQTSGHMSQWKRGRTDMPADNTQSRQQHAAPRSRNRKVRLGSQAHRTVPRSNAQHSSYACGADKKRAPKQPNTPAKSANAAKTNTKTRQGRDWRNARRRHPQAQRSSEVPTKVERPAVVVRMRSRQRRVVPANHEQQVPDQFGAVLQHRRNRVSERR
jgi:hypothetical protein